jgi:diphthamide biosynthesis protein 7
VHFAPKQHTGPYLFGAATSTGSLGLYQLKRPDSTSSESSPSELHPWIEHLQTLQYVQPNTLITAFAWHPITADLVGITLSSGEIKICSTKGSDAQTKIATLPSHDLEAWTLAFQPDGKGTLSGGDDSVLKYCGLPDISLGQSALSLLEDLLDHQSDSQTTWLDRKTHGAGVTAILPLSNDILVTGSYDDHIRIIHAPPTGRKTVLAEMNLGGGVWRLKTLSEPKVPFREKFDASAEVLLLVSCMHAGTRIVKIVKNTEDWSFEVLAKFEEHKSMNYGSDIQPGHRERLYTFISTSFYDRLLCLWRF